MARTRSRTRRPRHAPVLTSSPAYQPTVQDQVRWLALFETALRPPLPLEVDLADCASDPRVVSPVVARRRVRLVRIA